MVGVRQYMFRFGGKYAVSEFNFWLLVVSTILIAAAGNIINDYFDVRADRVNRPESVIIGRHVKRRWAIVSHWCFNIMAFCTALYLGWYYQSFIFLIVHFTSITFLWWYSVSLKKKPVVGNLLVAFLTVLVIFLTQQFVVLDSLIDNRAMADVNDRVFDIPSVYIVWIFMGMAFVQNLAREIIKDAEDVKGDLVIGARTIPMILGEKLTTKLIGALLLIFPMVYFWGIITLFESFNWMASLPITLAALANFAAFGFAFFSDSKKAVRSIKILLKLSMLLGIIYLFLPQ